MNVKLSGEVDVDAIVDEENGVQRQCDDDGDRLQRGTGTGILLPRLVWESSHERLNPRDD